MPHPPASVLVLLLACASARAQTTLLVSRAPNGLAGDAESAVIRLSGDSRFAAFHSSATNLVLNDTNGVEDVFVRDLWTNALVRESVSSAGAQADGDSRWGTLSADGRFLAFQSTATNLVPGDTNGCADVFVRDRTLQLTTRVSVGPAGLQADGFSRYPLLSNDGRLVIFECAATNLVPGDTNGVKDVFVHDRWTGITTRVSVATNGQEGNGDAGAPHISPDCRYVTYESEASNLVPGDTNAVADAFLHDLVTHVTTLVSCDAAGVISDGETRAPYLTLDARLVTFRSEGTNLVPGDTNGNDDVFIKDLQTGAVERVSVGSLGNEGHWDAYYGTITSDGRYVLFTSEDPNVVPNDTNGVSDLFLRDRVLGTLERVSVGFLGQQSNSGPSYPVISEDGRFVSFDSASSNLAPGDANTVRDVFLRDRWSTFLEGCAGDGSLPTACPCGNTGLAGRGCDNSAATGGALLAASGSTIPDHVRLDVSGELPNALTIFLQGDAASANGFVFGDGLRCVSGQLLRLYVKGASGGAASAPLAGDVSINQRAADLGAPIALGSLRWVQAYYRDPNAGFCPGATFNASSALRIAW